MFYLENCQPVVPYQAEEFSGDSVINNQLEIQQPLSGNPFNESGVNQPGIYYLVVEPMPGFNIQASMIQIGGLSGIGPTTFTWNTFYGNNSVIPSELNQDAGIQARDTLPDNPYSCNNKVFIRVVLGISFVMPSNNVTINIDLGGSAVECNQQTLTFQNSFLDFLLILGNGVNANPDCPLFVAKYYENQVQAASGFDVYNQESFSTGNTQVNEEKPPSCDPYGEWTSAVAANYGDEYFTGGALQNFQPTYYCEYKHYTSSGAALWNLNNTNNITTECGQLLYKNNYASPPYGLYDGEVSQGPVPVEHPNYDENPLWVDTIKRMDYRYKFNDQGYNGGFNSLNIPYLVPGVGYPSPSIANLLPSALRWYISVGNNSNYELLPENVDVYKIISAKGYFTPGSTGSQPDNTPCPIAGISYEQILTSEKANGVTIQNNSSLNIDNIQCVSVAGSNNKTVMLTVNFQSDYQENIWDTPANAGLPGSTIVPGIVSTQHRIFANVYPSEVTANPGTINDNLQF